MTAEQNQPRDCQLLLVSPPAFDAKDFAPKLEAALRGGDGQVAGFLLRLDATDDEITLPSAQVCQAICAEAGVAFFFTDRPDLTEAFHGDGVMLERSRKTIADVRRIIGDDKVLGVICRDGDHGMDAGNEGADMIAFDGAKEALFPWWQECFLLPCLALDVATTEQAAALAASGADFIALSPALWSDSRNMTETVDSFAAAVREALPSA